MIDCTWGSGNNGCRGGMPIKALEWVTENGVATKKSYGPYLGQVRPYSIAGHLISMSHKSESIKISSQEPLYQWIDFLHDLKVPKKRNFLFDIF